MIFHWNLSKFYDSRIRIFEILAQWGKHGDFTLSLAGIEAKAQISASCTANPVGVGFDKG